MKHLVVGALSVLSAAASLAFAQVERARFDDSSFALGVLTESDGALPRTLWDGAEARDIEEQLEAVPTVFDDPAKRLILRRVLLSPGESPRDADEGLAGLKLRRAVEAGYVMEAAALAELTPGLAIKPTLAESVAYRDLLLLQYDRACARGASLREGRQAPFFVRLRAFCYTHTGERAAADLTISLAKEEGVLSAADEAALRSLQTGFPTGALPENALQYAAFRKLGGLMNEADVETVAAPIVTAIAMDRNMSNAVRVAALRRAALEDLMPPRELGQVAESVPGTRISQDVGFIRALPQGSGARAGAVGEALSDTITDPADFLLRAKIFGAEMASTAPDPSTDEYEVEYSLACLLNGRYEAAERWIRSVATREGQGAETAFFNLTKLYSYLQPSAAQRLAGAIGEDLPPPPVIAVDAADRAAQRQLTGNLANVVDNGLSAATSGSQGAQLLAALSASTVVADGELGRIRDTVAANLYEAAGGYDIARAAVFRSAALSSAPRLRVEAVNPQFYRPRLKPVRTSR